ncbi:hypothetical protein F909_02824 [Acinetobacter sp. ANC 3929]|uniref:hypothetical protein n=1 Tax=unclassified Acinetobacter TaxID=196816 RepID=UPI0002D10035|nr:MULTISPECIES: hypothetical protein [unclassified Acinetobacter]ENW79721.1 hypothetical protein F909_02824 [Acinetobacter sp. ANC 3929]MCH7352013.1 hypothetical protein [Acinetobacter sp. NIPH 2023]MCH7359691.1 hypothetical protein [Acinetobacter sp. NIPH 2024]
MQTKLLIILGFIACGSMNTAYAIDAKYRQQLEQSGCTQVSEMQGCDIRKSKEENSKAGLIEQPVDVANLSISTQQPQWIAERSDGTTLALIKIDQQQRVWVNDSRVIAIKKKDQLTFRQGKIDYTIFTDLDKQAQSFWSDRYSTDKGKIVFR